jgi:hypothetical protein
MSAVITRLSLYAPAPPPLLCTYPIAVRNHQILYVLLVLELVERCPAYPRKFNALHVHGLGPVAVRTQDAPWRAHKALASLYALP